MALRFTRPKGRRMTAGIDLRQLPPEELSLAEKFSLLSPEEQAEISGLWSPEEQQGLMYDWSFWARPDQMWPKPEEHPDSDDWLILLLLAGRGSGKTRTGAELTRERWRRSKRDGLPCPMVFLGPTASDVRDLMVEGDSGILSVCSKDERPLYSPATKKLTWPDGQVINIRVGADPDDIRGINVEWAWVDEPVKFKYLMEAWDNLRFAMRLGMHPQTVLTTTPKRLDLLRQMVAHKFRGTVVRRVNTYRNAANLAPTFLAEMLDQYEGTRTGRQELHAEILEDVEGALWSWDLIDSRTLTASLFSGGQRWLDDGGREYPLPTYVKTTIAVDPSLTSTGGECGIMVGSLGADGCAYLREDLSLRTKPGTWAKVVVDAYFRFRCAYLVVEKNLPGEEVIRDHLKGVPGGDEVRVRCVVAREGKAARAEPAVGMYERAKVWHLGRFQELSEQLTGWVPGDTSLKSPDRLDALAWWVSDLLVKPKGGKGTFAGAYSTMRTQIPRLKP